MSCHSKHRKRCGPFCRPFPCRQGFFCAVAFGFLCLLFIAPTLALEEPVPFLEKLRAVGYLDTAGDYLEYLQKSDLVDAEFKKTIPYEKAVLLVAKASRVGDRGQTLALLKQAIEQFKHFAKSQPDSPRAIDVRFQITSVYLALAKASMARSQQPGIVKADAEKEARDYYQKALQEVVETEDVVQSSRKKVRAELSAARKAAGRQSGSQSSAAKLTPKEIQLIEQRDKLRTDWMNSELKQVLEIISRSVEIANRSKFLKKGNRLLESQRRRDEEKTEKPERYCTEETLPARKGTAERTTTLPVFRVTTHGDASRSGSN